MADRFEEMAREMLKGCGVPSQYLPKAHKRLETALRAESKRAQEAMREKAAKWHDEIADMTKADLSRNRHRRYATAIRNLPIGE